MKETRVEGKISRENIPHEFPSCIDLLQPMDLGIATSAAKQFMGRKEVQGMMQVVGIN